MNVRTFAEMFEVTLARPHYPGVCTLKDDFPQNITMQLPPSLSGAGGGRGTRYDLLTLNRCANDHFRTVWAQVSGLMDSK